MGKLKKIMIGLGICLLLVLLLGSCSYLFARPMYYRLFYPWDRVTGTVQVELDGESVPFTVEKLDGGDSVGARKDGSGGARVSMRGRDYGRYGFQLRIDGMEQPVRLTVHKWNWQVVKFDVWVSVDREKGSITLTGTVWETDDQGQFREKTISVEGELSEDGAWLASTSV